MHFKKISLKNIELIFLKTFLILPLYTIYGARDGSVCWGNALQAGRTQVQFPMASLEFFVAINFWPHCVALGSIQPLREMSTRNISEGGVTTLPP